MAARELAKKESKLVAVSANPDICRVDGALIPFDICRDLTHATKQSPDVNGHGFPLLFVTSVIQGVDGNQGKGHASGVAESCGYVFVMSGAQQIFCNGLAVAWNMSECEMNCTASGVSNGTKGYLYTGQSGPMCWNGYDLPAGPTPHYEVTQTDYTFNDCNDAITKMNEMAEHSQYVASTPWKADFKSSVARAIQNRNGTWTYSPSVDITITANVNMPRWANIPNDPDVIKAWNEMYAELLKHEEGHIKISHKGDQHIDSGQIKGVGSTEKAAKEDFKAKVIKKLEEIKKELSDEHDEYDAVTNHGKAQHLAGGQDVVLKSPTPVTPPGGRP